MKAPSDSASRVRQVDEANTFFRRNVGEGRMDFKCQACGFAVFNRRYPMCESCGVELAPGIALSKQEREAAFARETEEANARWREREKQERSTDNDVGAAAIGVTISGSNSSDF